MCPATFAIALYTAWTTCSPDLLDLGCRQRDVDGVTVHSTQNESRLSRFAEKTSADKALRAVIDRP